MLNRLASLAMSTCVLKALPGKLDIKRHSPSILYIWKPISYVQIYDGSKDETDLLGRFCNWTPPPTNYISRSNILHLRFQTNAWVSYSGFRIVYDIIKGKDFL